jgi:hypothetical protein
MAERVQVQGLGDAVPGIQPTIQRAGQYGVAQQRAGRNKLMDLADALGQVNPILKQYTQVADIEAEQFEEELARKSPEEIQAMLQKTEGELDKQVRKGTMSWLTSPLNQKRKLEAIGKLASRDLMVEVNKRLANPLEDDPEDGASIVQKVRDEYIENNPALRDSLLARQGLQKAINPQIQPLVTNFELRQSAVAKEELAFSTSSALFETVRNITGALDDDARAGIYDLETLNSLTEDWSNLNAYSPKEQRAIFTSVIRKLAASGNEDRADGFLNWAAENLNFGNAKMNDDEYLEYERVINKAAEIFEGQEEDASAELTENTLTDFKFAHDQLNSGEQEVEFGGQKFTNKNDLERFALNNPNLAADKEAFVSFNDQAKSWLATNVNFNVRKKEELKRNTPGLRFISDGFSTKVKGYFDQQGLLTGDAEGLNLLTNSLAEFETNVDNFTLQLTQTPISNKERQDRLLDFTRKEDERLYKELQKQLKTRTIEKTKEDNEAKRVADYLETGQEGLEAPEKGMFDKVLENLFGYDKKKGDLAETTKALKVLGAKEATPENKQKSFEFLRSYGIRTSAILSEQLDPNAWKVEPTLDTAVMAGPVPMTVKGKPGVRYSIEEREAMLNEWMNINGFLETFTSTDTLMRGLSPDGRIRFDATEFKGRTRITRLLSVATLEQAKDIKNDEDMPQEVKDKASIIGIDDLVQFVEDQREFAKRLRLIK